MKHKPEIPEIRLEDEIRSVLPLPLAAAHLCITAASMRMRVFKGESPVPTVKVGQRLYVRTNDLRAIAGLPPVPDRVGGAA